MLAVVVASFSLIATPAASVLLLSAPPAAVQMLVLESSRRAVLASVLVTMANPLAALAGLAEDESELLNEELKIKAVDGSIRKQQKLELDARALVKSATQDYEKAAEAGKSEKATNLKYQIGVLQAKLDDEARDQPCSNCRLALSPCRSRSEGGRQRP